MREIKFRAFQDNEMLTQPISGVYGMVRFMGLLYEDTKLMQYTGLKDKNGAEIYCGDIVNVDSFYEVIPHYPTDSETNDLIGLVKYVNGAWEVDSVPLYVLFETGQPEIEVIGNIHQNPELL